LQAVLRLEDLVSEIVQKRHGDLPNVLLILDDQDSFLPAYLFHSWHGGTFRCELDVVLNRNVHSDSRSPPDFAIDPDVTTGLFDEAVDHAESQAAALPNLLGRKEGFKDLINPIGGNAHASVSDCQDDIVSGCDLTIPGRMVFVEMYDITFYCEIAAVGHGVTRVDGQVQNSCFELVGIGPDAGNVLCKTAF
jgi:hypothetical protein